MFSATARAKGDALATLQSDFDGELDHDAGENAAEVDLITAIQAATALLVAEMPTTSAYICTLRSHGRIRADGTGQYVIEVNVQ